MLYGQSSKDPEVSIAKKMREKYGKSYRPGSNIRETKRMSPQPRYVLDKIIPISKPNIEKMVDTQDKDNQCKDLSVILDMHTSFNRDDVKSFNNKYQEILNKKKHALKLLLSDDHIPDQKVLDNSKIMQLAFLDKIIEECDEDQDGRVK